jgi:SAM-dependent methyltransferase
MSPARNLDPRTVSGFGHEWDRYDQANMPPEELERCFIAYFRVFPWEDLPPAARGYDLGCGSGRWAALVAPRVGELTCVDASTEALDVARRRLADQPNLRFVEASVDELPFAEGSMDFGYSLGVLHHVPDTAAGIRACVRALKPRAPLLLYLYYAFDNRPLWYRGAWRLSDRVRRVFSRLPFRLRVALTEMVARTVYWPLARAAQWVEKAGYGVQDWPLAVYRNSSLYTMRTDALDRFGTRLEQRFTRAQIQRMMEAAGLENIVFSGAPPYWCVMGRRRVG